MPLVRFPVRNEFALGQPELYTGVDREDPKAVLDGVAVAGLVGILRQLGDLAEFAAEVFHGLQEQVMTTASRSHKLRMRVQRIEATLPALEKVVLAQTSHVHFAYTAGSQWHPRLQNEKNQFIYNDLPQFIMNSYEGCRDPPRLHLLDKFNTGGPGSCLKRYSDPTFFRRASGDSIEDVNSEQVRKDKKSRKSKRKSSSRKRELPHVNSNHRGRMQFTPVVTGRSSSSQTASTVVNDKPSPSQTESTVAEQPSGSTVSDTRPPCQDSISVDQPAHLPMSSMVVDDVIPNLDIGDSTDSLISRTESGYIEFSNLSASVQYEEQESEEKLPSYVNFREPRDSSELPIVQTHAVENTSSHGLSHEKVVPNSYVTWDEKAEILEFREESCDIEEVPEMHIDLDNQVHQAIHHAKSDRVSMLSNNEAAQAIFCSDDVDEIESETDSFEDALNTIESESEGNIDCQTKREVDQYSCDVKANEENEMHICSDSRVDFQAIESGCLSPEVKDESQVAKIPEQIENNANHDPVLAKCHVTSIISSGLLEREGLHDSSTSVDGTDKQMAETSNFITPSGSDCAVVLERPNIESVDIAPSSTGPGAFVSPDPSSAHAKVLERPNIESVATVPSSIGIDVVNLPDPSMDRIIDSVSESKTSHFESSSTHSIGLWTNGGLLGLEPSKPPVFAATNLKGHNDEAKDIEVNGSSNCANVIKFSDSKGKPISWPGNPNGMENSHKFSHVKASTLIADLDRKSVKTGDSFPINSIDQNVADSLSSKTMIPGGKVVSPATKATSTESGQMTGVGLVRIFGLGNRLLANGISNSEDVSFMKTGVEAEQELRNPSARFNRNAEKAFGNQLESGSPVSSRISSPPLQHMKISFNPVNGFETSKLKLKFPDQSHRHESITDLFASFQLVPSSGFRLQDDDSDSDDDTFCRSSSYMSDDCDSHYSESNSEQWESDESPESKDPELYEAFRRMPYLDSVSCLVQDEEETIESIHTGKNYKDDHNNAAETNVSDSLVEFPSSGSRDPSLQENIKTNAQNNLLQLQNAQEPTPLAPPLPPEQWRVSKSFTSLDEEKPSKSTNVKFDTEVLASTMSQKHQIAAAAEANQPQITDEGILFKPEKHQIAAAAEANQPQITDEGILFKPEKKIIEKPNLHKGQEASQSMRMDTKDDFLQQIRSKSINLRPTVTTEKQTAASGIATNVTAILKKASAIRQAVGSDDGEEDDTWSDTS